MVLPNDTRFPAALHSVANGISDLDDVRDRISVYLFKTQTAHPLDHIALIIGCDVATLRAGIDPTLRMLPTVRKASTYTPTIRT
jgi:hypothetical protein